MPSIFKNLFTGPDNQTFELAHFLWALAVVAFITMVAFVVVHTATYPSNFGTDFLALNGGGAAGAFARAKADQTLGAQK